MTGTPGTFSRQGAVVCPCVCGIVCLYALLLLCIIVDWWAVMKEGALLAASLLNQDA